MKHTTLITTALLLVLGVLPCAAIAATSGGMLEIEVHKGKRISLPTSATSVVTANSDIADVQVVSPRILYIYGKAIGETSIFAVDADENTIFDTTVNVTHDISSLDREVKRIAPDADITFKTVDNGLVMEGNASTLAEAENIRNVAETFLTVDSNNPSKTPQKLVNMIKTEGSDQVMLKVKIVEMARNDLKNMGINLQNVTNRGNFSLQLLQGNTMKFFPPPGTNTDLVLTPNSLLDRGANTDTNLMLRYNSLSGLIDALETQGLANILAEPNLTTTTGRAASFLAGGQFPIPTVGQNGTVTISYQPFGVSLNFTPVVMDKDRISLTVAPSVSTLNFSNPIQVSGITYPIIETRQASSVVELGSGDSFMLAGLIRNDSSNNINKFPGLGDLPILGALFRSTSFQNNETELVILVTPYIVHPVAEASKLQTPLDGYTPPSDLQLLMYGNLYQQQPMTGATRPTSPPLASLPKLNGAGGFIME